MFSGNFDENRPLKIFSASLSLNDFITYRLISSNRMLTHLDSKVKQELRPWISPSECSSIVETTGKDSEGFNYLKHTAQGVFYDGNHGRRFKRGFPHSENLLAAPSRLVPHTLSVCIARVF